MISAVDILWQCCLNNDKEEEVAERSSCNYPVLAPFHIHPDSNQFGCSLNCYIINCLLEYKILLLLRYYYSPYKRIDYKMSGIETDPIHIDSETEPQLEVWTKVYSPCHWPCWLKFRNTMGHLCLNVSLQKTLYERFSGRRQVLNIILVT